MPFILQYLCLNQYCSTWNNIMVVNDFNGWLINMSRAFTHWHNVSYHNLLTPLL